MEKIDIDAARSYVMFVIEECKSKNQKYINIFKSGIEYFDKYQLCPKQFHAKYNSEDNYDDIIIFISSLYIVNKFYLINLDMKIKNKKTNGDLTGLSTAIASHIERETQIQKYHNERAGHGFSAEDANALNDILHLRDVEKVGLGNELNGPDRIVDGVRIQVKYYKTAQESINSTFNESGFRYPGQVIEVPSDQYDEAIKVMQGKILNGEVTDEAGNIITDPEKAKDIIQSGSVTYEQAKNIAKAGNIDSIIFDVKNNCITSGCIFGLSFAINYAFCLWNGDSSNEALKKSVVLGLQSGCSALIVGVVTSQILRTTVAASGTVVVRSGIKVVSQTQIGKSAIEAIARMSLGKAVYGAAAINHVSKLLRSNVITSVVATAITTAPDFYRATISGSISWTQFSKNLGVNVAGVAGGAGGWFAGAAAGAAVGSVVPFIGTTVGGVVGGLLGALGGGIGASKATKIVADKICEDDAIKMIKIVQNESEIVACNYLLTKDEITKYVDKIKQVIDASWLMDMYKSGKSEDAKAQFANRMLSDICDKILAERKLINLPSEDEIIRSAIIEVNELLEEKQQDNEENV